MRYLSLTVLLTCGLTLVPVPRAVTQIGYLWSYDELLQKADLVVVGKCAATSDTGRQTIHPELSPPLPVVEMRSTIRVEVILKSDGQARVGADVRLRYYRFDLDRWRKEHPPEPGKPPLGLVNGGGQLTLDEGRGYLLFFKRAADGAYEPVSGHTFPNDSVYGLDHEPGGAPLGQGKG